MSSAAARENTKQGDLLLPAQKTKRFALLLHPCFNMPALPLSPVFLSTDKKGLLKEPSAIQRIAAQHTAYQWLCCQQAQDHGGMKRC